MAYIKKKSERKFKITVCNGYKVNGQKRMKAQTITVPSSVPKRGIQQYVMAEAERIEKKFKYGVEESDQTHFEQYAENWLKRQEPFFKATTYAGYKRNLDIVYPLIGGIPLAKLLPMTLEEMCEELRKRPGRGGNCIKETTVQKYLETVSSVLEAFCSCWPTRLPSWTARSLPPGTMPASRWTARGFLTCCPPRTPRQTRVPRWQACRRKCWLSWCCRWASLPRQKWRRCWRIRRNKSYDSKNACAGLKPAQAFLFALASPTGEAVSGSDH